MALGALVALRVLVPALKQARAGGDLDASAALTFAMGWLITLPTAVVAISGGLNRPLDVFGNAIPIYPSWYPRGTQIAILLVGVLAVVLLVRQLTSGPVPVHPAGLFAILLWAVAHLSAGLHGGSVMTFRGGVLLLCLTAATVLPRGRGACLGAGLYGVTLALASAVLTLFQYDAAFVIPVVKAFGIGFQGVLPNENLLGIGLAASIPFTYLGFRGPARYWLIAYLTGMVLATGSQTAIAASALTVAALVIVRPRVDSRRSLPGLGAIAGIALAAALFVSIDLPQHNWAPNALRGRAALWNTATQYIEKSPWIGYGPDKWSTLYQTSQTTFSGQRSAHNQWFDVLFDAGWVGAALYVGMMAAMILSARRARTAATIALATIVTIGAAEGAWSIGTYDLLSYSLVALILLGPPDRVESADDDAEQLPARFHPWSHIAVPPAGWPAAPEEVGVLRRMR
jgi:O-antigen ligase